MVNDFYKDDDDLLKERLIDKLKKNETNMTIATIQDYFIRFRDINEAISNIEELY